jgi:hypothetical protein
MCKRISKKQLSYVFGLYSRRTGRHYPNKLRTEVFTDTVLEELNLSPEEYARRRTFDYPTSRRIIEYFKIPDNALD